MQYYTPVYCYHVSVVLYERLSLFLCLCVMFGLCITLCFILDASLEAQTFVEWSCGTLLSALPLDDNKVSQLHATKSQPLD